MAKDRTRHARIREPKQESQADIATLEIGQAFVRISEDTAMALSGFSEGVAIALSGFSDWATETMDCIKRILEAQNGNN